MNYDELHNSNLNRKLTPASAMLLAINSTMSHVYGGTVPPAEVRRRRAANKVARASRKINRRRGK